MDLDALQEVLKKHSKWLQSGQNDGNRAELCGQDLSGCMLNESILIMADLSGVDLKGASLNKTNLKAANLRGAHLREADFRGANLIDADLTGANCIKARIREAFVRGANLNEAHLLEADMRDTNFIEANFLSAKMRSSDLRGATLVDANLMDADLTKAKLRGAKLRGASLRGASLVEVDMTKADLHGADLTGADLSRADLSEATLTKATLCGVNFEDTLLNNITIDNETYDQIPYVIREKFEREWKFENFNRVNMRPIIRTLELPDFYRSAGIALLHYFAKILQHRHPELKVKFIIELRGQHVDIIINPIIGDRDIIEKAMTEFANVIKGLLPINQYTDDPFLAMELQKEMEYAEFVINAQRDLVQYRFGDDQKKVKDINIEGLRDILNRFFAHNQ